MLRYVVKGYLSRLTHDITVVDSPLEIPSQTNVIITEVISTSNDLALIRKIHKVRSGIPIILVYDMPIRLQLFDAQNYGIWAYLRKPFSLAELDMALWQATRQEIPQSRKSKNGIKYDI